MQKLTYIQLSSSLWSSTILQNQIIWCEQTAKTWLSHPIEVAIDNFFADRKRHKIGKKTNLFLCSGKIRREKRLRAIMVCNLIFLSPFVCCLRAVCCWIREIESKCYSVFFLAWLYTFCKVAHQKYCQHGVSHAAYLSYIVRFGVYL